MNRKRNIWALAVASMFMTAFAACSDWTEVEAEQKTAYDNTETNRPDTYYQALREWKKSEHSISFGWYSGWGENTSLTTRMLAGLPDSMDVVSLWDNSRPLSEGKIKDLRYVQQVKGTKVVTCSFTSYVGQGYTPEGYDRNADPEAWNAYWGWVEDDEAAIEAAIRKYARTIIDTMEYYGYDGFDIDYEPNFGFGGPLASSTSRMHIFIEELGKYIGPMSPNPEKLLIVDGEPQTLNAETGPYISYFVVQAYTTTGTITDGTTGFESNMDRRFETLRNKFISVMDEEIITNRYVITENLESAIDCLNGGFWWRFRDGSLADKKVCPSLVGMARWEPLNGFRKGGFGAYKFSNEAVNKPSYKWMRRAIQDANPAVN